MLRLGLRLLVVAVALMAVGWLSIAHWAFEVVRAASIACLALALVLLILDYARAPEAPGG